jgi:hypothetical protein
MEGVNMLLKSLQLYIKLRIANYGLLIKVVKFGLSLVLIFMLFSCTSTQKVTQQVKLDENKKVLVKEPVYIVARGVGSPPPDLSKVHERRMSADRASISAAIYQLISFLKPMKIKIVSQDENVHIIETTLEKRMNEDASFKKLVEDTVRELIEVIKQEWHDDTCITTIRIDKNKLEEKLKVKLYE